MNEKTKDRLIGLSALLGLILLGAFYVYAPPAHKPEPTTEQKGWVVGYPTTEPTVWVSSPARCLAPYEVREGDTLSGIILGNAEAKNMASSDWGPGQSYAQIQARVITWSLERGSKITNPDDLRVGQQIWLTRYCESGPGGEIIVS